MDSHFLKVAYVSKPHGIKGELFIQPFNPQASWPSGISSIKIGEQIFSMEYYSKHKQGFIVKLKNCDTKESADRLKSCLVFLAKEYFISKKAENIYLAELIGFTVEIAGHAEWGRVLEFQSDKQTDFLALSFNSVFNQGEKANKDDVILVPFVSSYIQTIDFEKKKMVLNLPENFLSVFNAK